MLMKVDWDVVWVRRPSPVVLITFLITVTKYLAKKRFNLGS